METLKASMHAAQKEISTKEIAKLPVNENAMLQDFFKKLGKFLNLIADESDFNWEDFK